MGSVFVHAYIHWHVHTGTSSLAGKACVEWTRLNAFCCWRRNIRWHTNYQNIICHTSHFARPSTQCSFEHLSEHARPFSTPANWPHTCNCSNASSPHEGANKLDICLRNLIIIIFLNNIMTHSHLKTISKCVVNAHPQSMLPKNGHRNCLNAHASWLYENHNIGLWLLMACLSYPQTRRLLTETSFAFQASCMALEIHQSWKHNSGHFTHLLHHCWSL